MNTEDSTIVKILEFEDTTGNADLDTQLDETATELFERRQRFATLEELTEALQKGIYGD